MASRRVPALLAYLLLVIAGWPVSAQTNTGEIVGVVRDAVGGVLPGVAVTARHPDSRARPGTGDRRRGALFPAGASAGNLGDQGRAGRLRAPNRDGRAGDRADAFARHHARPRRPYRAGAGLWSDAAPADHDRRNQRRHQHPGRGADAAQRPEFHRARAIERRRGHPSRRHARRGAAAGGTAAERRRAALRPQHLPAGRREGDRRAVQQPRHQSFGRFDPGVQDPEVDVRAGVRRQGLRAHQCRDSRRLELLPRHALRIPARRRLRFTELFPSAWGTRPSASAGPVRRDARRTGLAQPLVLFRQLRAAADGALTHARLFGALDGGARRRLRRFRSDLRSADDPDDRHVYAVREQPDPGGADRSRCARGCWRTFRRPHRTRVLRP